MKYEIADGMLKASVNTGDVFTIDGKKHNYTGANMVVERRLTSEEIKQAQSGTLEIELLVLNQLLIDEVGKLKERLGFD